MRYQQNNKSNCSNFKALKGVTYSGGFSPSRSIGNAKAVKSFLKNNAIKDFCSKHDVFVDFGQVYDIGILHALVLKCEDLSKDGDPLRLVFHHEDENISFAEYIDKISTRTLAAKKDKALKSIQEEESLRNEHKNILNTIDELLSKYIK